MTEATETDSTYATETLDHRSKGGITCYLFRQGKEVSHDVSLDEVSNFLHQPDALVWVDVVDPNVGVMDKLASVFHLHPLAIEDAVQAHQRPKIEAYGTYWFIVVKGVTMKDQDLTFHEVAIFASNQFVVTVRQVPAYPWDEVQQRWRAHPESLKTGGGFLLYTMLDSVVDDYGPVDQMIEDRVDRLEEQLCDPDYQNQLKRLLPEIFNLKKQAQEFRHAAVPMRDILNPLVR